MVCYQ